MCIWMCTHTTHYRYLGRDGVLVSILQRKRTMEARQKIERKIDGWMDEQIDETEKSFDFLSASQRPRKAGCIIPV